MEVVFWLGLALGVWSWLFYKLGRVSVRWDREIIPGSNRPPIQGYIPVEREGPKYTHITIRLTGLEGNPLAILRRCRRVMLKAELPGWEHESFWNEATSGDYDNLVETVALWFKVE